MNTYWLVKKNAYDRTKWEAWWSQWPYENRPTTLKGKTPDQNWIDVDDDDAAQDTHSLQA